MNINSTIISVGLRSRGELWQLNKIKARFQAKYGEMVKLRVVSSYNGPKSVMYLRKMRLALVLLIKYAIIMTSIHFVKINIAWTIARVLYYKMLQFFGTQITNKQVVILYLQVKYLFFFSFEELVGGAAPSTHRNLLRGKAQDGLDPRHMCKSRIQQCS